MNNKMVPSEVICYQCQLKINTKNIKQEVNSINESPKIKCLSNNCEIELNIDNLE